MMAKYIIFTKADVCGTYAIEADTLEQAQNIAMNRTMDDCALRGNDLECYGAEVTSWEPLKET